MADQLITRNQAAIALSLKPQTLAKWSLTGKVLPVVRFPGVRTVRYRLSDVQRLIDGGAVGDKTNPNPRSAESHNPARLAELPA
jgi:hypothetical protein